MEHDVFISHSEQDKAVADAVCARLEQRGIRCWIAPRDVPVGHSWAAALVEAIGASRLFLLILSNGSNASQQVIREVGEAVDNTLPIIPFRIENVEPSDEMRYYIKSLHWLDAMSPPLEWHIDQLVTLVEASLGAVDDLPRGAVVAPSPSTPGPSVAAEAAVAPWYRRPVAWVGGLVAVALLVVAGFALSGGDRDGGSEDERAATSSADASVPMTSSPSTMPPTAPPTLAATTAPEPSVQAFEDSFDRALKEGWTWLSEDPSSWSFSEGGLEVTATDVSSNRLVREAPTEPYEITTHLRFSPTSNFQFAGLIVQGDDEADWIQLGRAYCAADIAGCLGDGIYFDNIRDGELFGVSGALPYEGGEDIYFRIAADGGRYAGYYSSDGESWTPVGAQTGDDSFRRIGLVAHQAYEAPVTAEFDFVAITEIGADYQG